MTRDDPKQNRRAIGRRACLVALVVSTAIGGVTAARAQVDGPAAPDGGVPDAGASSPEAGAPPAGDAGTDDAGAPPAPEPPPDEEEEKAEGEPEDEPEDEPASPGTFDAEDLGLTGDQEEAEEAATPPPEDGAAPPAAEPSAVEDEETFEPGELAITASPNDWFRTGGSVTSLDEENLETFEMDNPNAVLLQAPGVYVRSEDGYGLRPNIGIRGASPERSKKITLMEDGVLFAPAPYAAPAAYYFPLMTRMVGVDVYKGPSAIKYGPHTVGGAVDLRTREVPDEPGGAIDVAFGNNTYRKAHLHYGARNDWGGILFEGVYLGTNGFKNLDGGGDTGFDKLEGMLKAFVHTDLDAHVYHRLDLKLGAGREVSDETYMGLSDEDFRQNPYRRYAATQLGRMEWWRTQVQVSHTLGIGADFELVTTAYRHDYDRSWRKLNRFQAELADPTVSLSSILSDPGGPRQRPFYEILTGERDTRTEGQRLLIGTNARRFVSQGIQSVAQYGVETGETAHELEAGLRFHHDQIDRDHTEEPFAMTQGTLVSVGDEELILDNLGRAFALAGHVAYGVTWKGLTVTPGIRTELIWTDLEDQGTGDSTQAGPRVAVLPGIGLHYAITEELGVLAGVHRGFSPVSPGQPEEVDPEFSTNYEAGVRFAGEDGLRLEAIGFVSDYSNLLAECRFSTGCTPTDEGTQANLGEALVYGLEAVAAHRLELADAGIAFPLRAAYTYTGSRLRTTFTSTDPLFGEVDEGDPLPYVPEHQLSLRAGVEMDDWGVNLLGTYVGAMPEKASDEGILGNAVTDDYFMLNAEAHYQVTAEGKVYLQLRNILSVDRIASRRPFGARPVNPFLVMAGFEHAL